MPPIAVICAGRNALTSNSGNAATFPRHVGRSGSAAASRRVRARVAGCGNAKTRRALGFGS